MVVAPQHLEGEIADPRGEHPQHRGSKRHLHIVGHTPHVARTQPYERRPHRDERPHEPEDRPELRENLRLA